MIAVLVALSVFGAIMIALLAISMKTGLRLQRQVITLTSQRDEATTNHKRDLDIWLRQMLTGFMRGYCPCRR